MMVKAIYVMLLALMSPLLVIGFWKVLIALLPEPKDETSQLQRWLDDRPQKYVHGSGRVEVSVEWAYCHQMNDLFLYRRDLDLARDSINPGEPWVAIDRMDRSPTDVYVLHSKNGVLNVHSDFRVYASMLEITLKNALDPITELPDYSITK